MDNPGDGRAPAPPFPALKRKGNQEEEPLRVAIVGSRDFSHLEWVDRYVDSLPEGAVVVSGGARGVDRRAEQAARRRGLKVESFTPLWYGADGKYDGSAGFARNQKIVERAHAVVAFYSGSSASSGTRHVMKIAEAAGKLALVIQGSNIGEMVVEEKKQGQQGPEGLEKGEKE